MKGSQPVRHAVITDRLKYRSAEYSQRLRGGMLGNICVSLADDDAANETSLRPVRASSFMMQIKNRAVPRRLREAQVARR